MYKIDVVSGFLGAGKTTLISKLLKEVFPGQKVVLVENEFGEIGIDGGFLKEAGIQINEINSGCICCTLKGDFQKALRQVIDTYHPDHILIEPSGVGKLSDILRIVKSVDGTELDSYSTVVDAARCRIYHKNFREFFDDQIATASCVILSKTQNVDEQKLAEDTAIIRELNPQARIITTPWDSLSGQAIFDAMCTHRENIVKVFHFTMTPSISAQETAWLAFTMTPFRSSAQTEIPASSESLKSIPASAVCRNSHSV